MKLIIEPNDGVAPLISAIRSARKSLEIAIFRFDHRGIEMELQAAAARGVKVTALIASVNRGGTESLRKLELRCLAAGLTVVRTDDDLKRYHDKFFIIDRRVLYVLSFNLTHMDIDRSRGFGIVTKNSAALQAAIALFEADRSRTKYTPRSDLFIVSPHNARKALGSFLKRARKQLLIYDPKISDRQMLNILRERTRAGVEIRVLGRVVARFDLEARKLVPMRLHTRTIIRDGHQAFVGSQSLRGPELDSRRELGLIVRNAKTVKRLMETFESDWKHSDGGAKRRESLKEQPQEEEKPRAEEVAEVLAAQLDPLTASLKKTVKRVVSQAGTEAIEGKAVKTTVKKVVKRAVKEAIQEVVQGARV